MNAISSALIVGGGIAGLTAAIALRRMGVHVDVVELNPRVSGAGVGLSANALRALQSLGVADNVLSRSMPNESGNICDAAGKTIVDTPRAVPPEWGLPANVVVGRPDLSEVLGDNARKLGASIEAGVTVTALAHGADGVAVDFSNGRQSKFDLVIGADGLASTTRSLAFGDVVHPDYAGQCGWRWFAPMPPTVERGSLLLSEIGGLKLGIYPLPGGRAYCFTTAPVETLDLAPPLNQRSVVIEQLGHFQADFITDLMTTLPEPSEIFYSPFSTLLVPRPWHRGAIVLIGDAAHTVTPHSSSGAALAIEDGVVLAEVLSQYENVEAALEAFTNRRFARVEKVLNYSRQACLDENRGGPPPSSQATQAFWQFLLEPI